MLSGLDPSQRARKAHAARLNAAAASELSFAARNAAFKSWDLAALAAFAS